MPDPWRNRIVGSGNAAPSDLLANPNNWRTHPPAQRDALRGALSTVGWVQQVVVNTVSGHVVDGHARIEEAISREEPSVPVLYVELDPEEEALVLATLDPIGAMASVDQARLADLLAEVTVDDEALRKMLGDLVKVDPRHGLTDPDDAPDLGEGSNVKLGDLFVLGDHRLMCGDCTDPVAVARLWDGAMADIVWTDPPYGVDYTGKTKDRLKIDNDHDWQTQELLAAALRSAPLRPGGAFYIASASSKAKEFIDALVEVGLRLRQQLVWVKDVFVMGRSDYQWKHEVVLYGWAEGAAHHWAGGRDQDTVWEIPRPKRSEEHPTMKPVELVARALANSSRVGEAVYDPFVGSGTTIIASEQLGRKCYAMEIDPRYVAVAIERWEKFTGRKAEKLGAEDPFEAWVESH